MHSEGEAEAGPTRQVFGDEASWRRWEATHNAALAYAERMERSRMHALDSIKSYGQASIRGLFSLNAGASIALLTFIGSLYSKAPGQSVIASALLAHAADALWYFSAGLLLSLAASAIGYFNYHFMASAHWDPGETHQWLVEGKMPLRSLGKWGTLGQISAWIAVAALAGSTYCFICGGTEIYHALRSIVTI